MCAQWVRSSGIAARRGLAVAGGQAEVTRSFDLSTGVAPWIAIGPGLPEGRPLGVHAGRYRIEIAVTNGTADRAALGLLARLKLTMTCGRK